MFLMGELVGVALIGNRRSPGGDGGNTAMMRGASWVIDPLNATVDEFVAEGFTHIQCYLPSMSHDKAKADQLASPHLFGTHHRSFQRGYAARSAVVHCTRSSRGGWKTFLGSRWGVEGDRHFRPSRLAFSVS